MRHHYDWDATRGRFVRKPFGNGEINIMIIAAALVGVPLITLALVALR